MRIRLLGGLDVTSPEGEPIRFSMRKTSLLFAALVLAGRRGHRREPLAEAFWPGRGDAQARNSLRQALVDIRRSFPSGGEAEIRIEGDQDGVVLKAEMHEVDVWLFDRKLEEGRPADLALAADLYRDDILTEVAIPEELDEWFGFYRTTYRRKALQLVERLSLVLPAAGSAEETACESLAERLLASDPTAEPAHRALIRIHAGRGHENAARRQFELCHAALKKHVGAEPEAETSALAASLRPGDGNENSRAIPAPQGVAEPRDVAEPRGVAKPLGMPQPPVSSHSDRPSVAVLPFQNLSGDKEQDYFADGIVEDIITKLAQFRHLFVIACQSSFAYRGEPVDTRQIGLNLGVRYIVEGSVRRAGERLRISGQLIDSSSGLHLWADRFDGALTDVFDLQDQIASSIVGAITPRVEEAEIERSKRKPTESLDAYDYYLRGVAIHDRTAISRETIDAALQLFTKAIERDPAFAAAYARAARCYASRKSHRWMADPAKETAEATGLARRAIELGRDDAIALSYGGYVLGYVGGDLDESALCIDRALALNANLAVAWGYSAWIEACLGEPEKAIERAALAMRLSPRDPRLFAWEFNTALACFCAGRYMDAVGWARRALRSQPNYASAIRVTAASYALEGQILQASEMMARLRQLDPTLRLSNLSDILPPFRRPADRANYIEGLRRAGLPE
ncbi:BTAD domain-containing putative transcriptional regulator [Rhizobium fabae]|uniref:Adenylate cyclase n=1 Tax=Rhizobium fabae TaxID=573179 RepID=A0A7W6BCY8_9HYPH|nr:BTAD domain-containing putative transcriptional regulator [Rhizobium fabae]MBB3918328.1 TolB-like protein/DNA-binding SARP family transcriptional activator [Rhizobium fabae]RUM08576.1 adenylate cyclase [Rhizobium fabae]